MSASSLSILGRTATVAAALALIGAPGAAQAAAKTARLIEPALVATFNGIGSDESWMLFEHPNSLLRADGSFGYFPLRYAAPHEDQPMELLTFGGPIPAGTFRHQNVVGGAGGTLPFPGLTASGVEGYDWVFDDAEWRNAKPGEQPETTDGWVQSEPSLLAIDDRGAVAKRVSLNFGPRTFTKALVPTGVGLRAIIRVNDQGLDVRRSDGTLLAHLPQLNELRYAVGRPDGAVLLSGWSDSTAPRSWSTSLIKVSSGGKITRVRDGGKFAVGDPMTNVRGGTLLGTPSAYGADSVTMLSSGGDSRRRKLTDLRVPWSDECLDEKDGFSLDWATAGSAGDPVISVTCFREGDRTNVTIQTFTIGLDSKLRARWVAPAISVPRVGPDGRLYSAVHVGNDVHDGTDWRSSYQLLALREPGASKPRRGRVVSAHAEGQGAVAAIRCNAPEGTVCSGHARLTRRGSGQAVVLPYALRGRAGRAGGLIYRHFDAVPAGSGKLLVRLGS